MTTFENVRVSVQSRKTAYNLWTRAEAHEDINQKTRKILETVRLLNKKDALSANLSHGEQRHLEIGIALGTEPFLLLLDEPTAGLNPAETKETTAIDSRDHERLIRHPGGTQDESHHEYLGQNHRIP